MSPLSEADREQMLTWYPEQFLIQGDRNDYDYIYSREKLATLAGKKMPENLLLLCIIATDMIITHFIYYFRIVVG